MRKLILLLLTTGGFFAAFGQKAAGNGSRYFIGAQYSHEFVLDGFVRVREWEFTGDKMQLRDLGMRNYPALQLSLERGLRKNRSLTLVYDHYFLRGNATFDRDITYNGTIIDGRKGIDVSPTRYYRLTLKYRANLLENDFIDLDYIAGLVFDHVVFYLDGVVSPASTKNEVYEGFGRQAFPYPFVGLNGEMPIARSGHLNLQLGGTYIPEFKSFYTEGGHVYLQYSMFQADVSYQRQISRFALLAGAKLRYMHLFQESAEDTNILRTYTGGPYVGVVYGL